MKTLFILVHSNALLKKLRCSGHAALGFLVSPHGRASVHLVSATWMMHSLTHHYPEYFTKEVTLKSLMERGNILTVHTGCLIVIWSYQGKQHVDHPLNDCQQHAKNGDALHAHIIMPKTAHQVEEYNSIYVPIVKLEHFVNETLPHIQNDFVLISGQNSLPPEPIPWWVYDIIIEHSQVVWWFLQNLPINAYDPHHPKLAPFPYGIHPLQSAPILKEMKNTMTKDNFIYLSWFKISNNRDAWQHIPIWRKSGEGWVVL